MQPAKNVYPDNYSNRDRQALLALLDLGRTWVKAYNGTWKAQWLLSDIHDPIWILKTNKSRLVKDEWTGVVYIYWDIGLPDGTRLTEPVNRKILMTMQRMSFLVRYLPSFGITKTGAHHSWIGDLCTLTSWLFLHNHLYQPRKYLYGKFSSDAAVQFARDVARGGKAWALQIPERLLSEIYKRALNSEVPLKVLNDPFQIPARDRQKIIIWLRKSIFYTSRLSLRDHVYPHLNRHCLAKLISANVSDFKSRKINCFLRQFEPELLAINRQLLIPAAGMSTEYPSHLTLTLKEASRNSISYSSLKPYLQMFREIMRLRKHLPVALPKDGISLTKCYQIMNSETEDPKHTPWVPLEIALKYTTEALRWVAIYGESIAKTYVDAVNHFHKKKWFNDTDERMGYKGKQRDDWVNKHLPKELSVIRINGWKSVFRYGENDFFRQFRTSPGLNDALQVLIGAALVLISITKPMREEELVLLSTNCLTIKRKDGFWLKHSQEKTGADTSLIEIARPIPTITAKAIMLIAKISRTLKKISGEQDPLALNSLFYLPVFQRNGNLSGRLIDREQVYASMERFCDFVALPVDNLGRRWYLRPHECRKTFLITFFWCFRYGSLDAARWMAGQSHEQDIYDYIQSNFPGEELPQIEAEYASKQLWDFVTTGNPGETKNIDQLYKAVCHHFGVNEINAIRREELETWLELAFRKKVYEIRPYVMKQRDKKRPIVIAFIIREDKSIEKR